MNRGRIIQDNEDKISFHEYCKKINFHIPKDWESLESKQYAALSRFFCAGFKAGKKAQRDKQYSQANHDLTLAFFAGLNSCKESKKEQL